MNIEIPKANTHRDVAKEQHLVPRTYMRKWSYNNSDSIYVFDKNKREKGVQPANVNSINYIVGFHDIKAGDVFVPDGKRICCNYYSKFCGFRKSNNI